MRTVLVVSLLLLVTRTLTAQELPVQTAKTASGILVASDYSFGTVARGSLTCNSVTLRNQGDSPLQITGALFWDSSYFFFDDASKLPMTLAPGAAAELSICYFPLSEVMTIDTIWWVSTGSTSPTGKSFSALLGSSETIGVRPQADQVSELALYPNPASDALHVSLSHAGDVNGEISCVIYDVLGHEMQHATIRGSGGVLDVRSLPSGSYVLRVGNATAVSRPFVIL